MASYDEDYFKRLHKDIAERLQSAIDNDGVEFIIRMVSSFHSCEGAALYNMNDYLNSKNY